MTNILQMIELFERLAQEEYDEAQSVLIQIPYPENPGWLIEASRVLDALHIKYSSEDNKESAPDYEILFRGWNPSLLTSILYFQSDIDTK